MWVHSVNTSNRKHVTNGDGFAGANSQRQRGSAFRSHGSTSGGASGNAGAGGVLLDRLRHVDLVKTQHAHAHHAVLELAADGIGGVEQTFHAFDQTSVSGGVDGGITGVHHSGVFVQLLLGLQQHQRSRRSGAGGAHGVTDALVSIGNVSVDGAGQLADTWLQHTLCKVIQLHGQFGRSEVHANMLLG